MEFFNVYKFVAQQQTDFQVSNNNLRVWYIFLEFLSRLGLKQRNNNMKNYNPINTFSQKPSVPQIVAYVLFSFQFIIFFVIIQKRIASIGSRITVIVLYCTTFAIQFISTAIISFSDPSDSFMIKYKNQREKVQRQQILDLLYCDICRSYVQRSSRHCRTCQRCVQNFDHHCVWVNNCVGGKNYKQFMVMIVFTCSSMVVYIASACILWQEKGYENFIIEMGFVWASSFIVLLFIILIFNLILLHIYLNYLGITTYQLIMQNKGRAKEGSTKPDQQLTQQTFPQSKGKLQRITQLQDTALTGQCNPRTDSLKKIELKENHVMDNEIYHQPSKQDGKQNMSEAKSVQQKQISNSHAQVNKIFPEVAQQNIFFDDQSSQKTVNRQSARISQFFTKSRSLKILIKNDISYPQKNNVEIFPKTCSHSQGLK